MSVPEILRRLFVAGRRDSRGLAGSWLLCRVEVPHSVREYELTLTSDGVCKYRADVTFQQGDVSVEGSGTWHTDGGVLYYAFGDHSGAAALTLDGDTLLLDHIPAMKVAAGTPCTFRRVGEKPL